MGGGRDSIVSQGTDEDSCLEGDYLLLSSHSQPALRDNPALQDEDDRVNMENSVVFEEVGEESTEPSSRVDFEVNERKRLCIYQEILQTYDELKIDIKNLKEAKEKILCYRPGAWTEKVGGLKLCDYDVPKTACLILVGPSGSGKSSLINRISKVFDDDKFAPARAQVSYNSLNGDGTYFLREYMIPREATSICLYDTRSLSDNLHENNRMLKNWMRKGVCHGELVVRNTDNLKLRKNLKHKDYKKACFSSKSRKVNFVIYVVNGLSVLNAMENTSETQHTETIVSTFNSPFLSFKDDKPVLVFTHGDLLSLSDRARVRAHLGNILGIPPTMQIFDIPESDDLVTESSIIQMLRYSLEHADSHYPQKSKVLDKLQPHKLYQSLLLMLLILGVVVAISLEQRQFFSQCRAHRWEDRSRKVHATHSELKVPRMKPETEYHAPPQQEDLNGKVHTTRPELKVPTMEPKTEGHAPPQQEDNSGKVHTTRPEPNVPKMKPETECHAPQQEDDSGKVHATHSKLKVPKMKPETDSHAPPQQEDGNGKVHATRPELKVPKMKPKTEGHAPPQQEDHSGKVHKKRPKQKVYKMTPEEWHKIRPVW